MASLVTTQRIDSLPELVKKEYTATTRDGKSHFKRIKWPTEFQNISTFQNAAQLVNDSNSGNILFTEAIKSGWTTASGPAGVLTGGTSRFFQNFENTSSTTTVSAIYEHIRGYVYRDFGTSAAQEWNNYLATTAGSCGLIISKTLSSASHAAVLKGSATGIGAASAFGPFAAVTAVRAIVMNRGFYKDRIKTGTWRMRIQPTGVDVTGRRGLDFDNDDKTDSMSGTWASVTGMQGLTGSLLNRGTSGSAGWSYVVGLNQKVMTGFTIAMRVKFVNAGSNHHTIIHRRTGNPSLSALGNNFNAGAGLNGQVVTQRYSDFQALSAIIGPTQTNVAPTWNGLLFIEAYDNGWTQFSASSITGGTSATFKITNDGGGQLYWSLTSFNGWSQTDVSSYIRFQPWTAWVYNPNFVAGVGASGNGLTGWVRSDGSVFDRATTGTGFSHGASGSWMNRFDALGITNYMSITDQNDGGGSITDEYLYKRLSSPTTKQSHNQGTPAYAIENGCDKIIIRFNATVSGGEGDSNHEPLQTEIIAIPTSATLDYPTSPSAVAISSYLNYYASPESTTAIGLTCELRNGIDRKFDHKEIDLWFKIGHAHAHNKFWAINAFQCEFVPATIYGLGNRNSTTATVTAYFDSSITSSITAHVIAKANNVSAGFNVGNNHPWISCSNYPRAFTLSWNVGESSK